MPLAHGGTGGAIVELSLIVGAIGLFAAVYLGKRKSPEDEKPREDW